MCRDAELALAHGADGLVFGCLLGDGTVDTVRMRRLVALAGGKQTVFHRAFDVTPNPFQALDILIDLGVTRVLTSGQMPSVVDGAALVAALAVYAAGRIEILPGGGITLGNARTVVQQTRGYPTPRITQWITGGQIDPGTPGSPFQRRHPARREPRAHYGSRRSDPIACDA